MICHIYRSERKAGAYLFLPEKDRFDHLPGQLRKLVGQLTWVMALDLSEDRPLAQADVAEVRRLLREDGYYLQLPPGDWIQGA